MNLPNKLTLTRIILVPVFMIFVSLTSLDGIVDGNFNATFYLLAGIVFAAASFTDYLDGHLARKWHMVTDFGKFADPLADKLLTTVAFIYMLRDGVCSPVVLCIILAREFAVSGLRMVAAGAKDGKVIAAMMDLLEEMAAQVTEHDNALDQVYDELETLDQDLDDVVSDIYADEDEDDEEDAEDDSTMYEVTCPNCGQISTLDEETLMDPEGDLVCPHCGATFDIELEGTEDDSAEETDKQDH